MKPRRILDRLAGLMPNPKPIVFDWTPEQAAAAREGAEAAHRGIFRDGRVEWDTPVPYLPTGKAKA